MPFISRYAKLLNSERLHTLGMNPGPDPFALAVLPVGV